MLDLDSTNELCRVLSDGTRVRLLALLGEEELSVAELTRITGLAQSRVSTHLGRLKEAGLVQLRKNGTTSYYAAKEGHMPSRSRAFWRLIREALDDPRLDADLERATEVIRARHAGRTWADTVAGQMERYYSPGRTWESMARGLLGFLDLGDVLDVASGDGALAELLAPRVKSMTCVDVSSQVVRAGERRLGHLAAVRFVQGDMHELPFRDHAFDDALLMNALPYAHDVTRVLREVARVLRPGGRLVGATLATHDHQDLVAAFDHVGLGFDPDELTRLLTQAGFHVHTCETTHRERRTPHFEVITLHAVKQPRNDQ